MASLEVRGRSFRVVFRLQGIKYSRTLKAEKSSISADALLRLEDSLDRIEGGMLVPPPGKDGLTLATLFGRCFSILLAGSLEPSTIQTMKIHQRQLKRFFGKAFLINGLNTGHLQAFMESRSHDAGTNGRQSRRLLSRYAPFGTGAASTN